jgi:hypothetical protein
MLSRIRYKRLVGFTLFIGLTVVVIYLSYRHICNFPTDFISAEQLDSLQEIDEYISQELMSSNITQLTDVTNYLETLGFSCGRPYSLHSGLQSTPPMQNGLQIGCDKRIYTPELYIADEGEIYQCFDVLMLEPDLHITAIFNDSEFREIIVDVYRK